MIQTGGNMFDSFIVKDLVQLINQEVTGMHLQKIYSDNKYRYFFKFRSNLFVLIDLSSHSSHLNLLYSKQAESSVETPLATKLKSLLEKRKLVNVYQVGFDRIVCFVFEGRNEVLDVEQLHLYVEIMGRYSNIILTDENHKILTALKYTPKNGEITHEIALGAEYTPLEDQRISFRESTLEYDSVPFSKISAGYKKLDTLIKMEHLEHLPINELYEKISNRKEYYLLFKNNRPYDFHKLKGEYTFTQYETLPALLSAYFSQYTNAALRSQKGSYRKILEKRHQLLSQKIEKLHAEIQQAKSAEFLKEEAELLQAFSYQLDDYSSVAQVDDYYHNKKREIELNPTKTIIQNSQKKYKKYRKLANSLDIKTKQLALSTRELQSIESLLYSLDMIETTEELDEVVEEMVILHLLSKTKKVKKNKHAKSMPLHFSKYGIDYYVGKNNAQNDQLTFKTRNKNFIWLHVKDIPGSHVIIHNTVDQVTDEQLEFGAQLAAFHSKAKGSSNVPVDYTELRHVKKPSGSPKGFVNYFHQKTIYITANPSLIFDER